MTALIAILAILAFLVLLGVLVNAESDDHVDQRQAPAHLSPAAAAKWHQAQLADSATKRMLNTRHAELRAAEDRFIDARALMMQGEPPIDCGYFAALDDLERARDFYGRAVERRHNAIVMPR